MEERRNGLPKVVPFATPPTPTPSLGASAEVASLDDVFNKLVQQTSSHSLQFDWDASPYYDDFAFLFKLLNQNQAIDKPTMLNFYQRTKLNTKYYQKMFSMADTTNDGLLDLQEFMIMMMLILNSLNFGEPPDNLPPNLLASLDIIRLASMNPIQSPTVVPSISIIKTTTRRVRFPNQKSESSMDATLTQERSISVTSPRRFVSPRQATDGPTPPTTRKTPVGSAPGEASWQATQPRSTVTTQPTDLRNKWSHLSPQRLAEEADPGPSAAVLWSASLGEHTARARPIAEEKEEKKGTDWVKNSVTIRRQRSSSDFGTSKQWETRKLEIEHRMQGKAKQLKSLSLPIGCEFELLPGEVIENLIEAEFLPLKYIKLKKGELIFTNYRIIFVWNALKEKPFHDFYIPIAAVLSKTYKQTTNLKFSILCKYFCKVSFEILDQDNFSFIIDFCNLNKIKRFCFCYQPEKENTVASGERNLKFGVQNELMRFGFVSEEKGPWTLYSNLDFIVSEYKHQILVLPRGLKKKSVKLASTYHDKNRLPSCTWMSFTKSSKPLVILRCERPIFVLETDSNSTPNDSPELNASWQILESIYLTSNMNVENDEPIIVVDTGSPNKNVMDHYSDFGEVIFLRLNEMTIKNNYESLKVWAINVQDTSREKLLNDLENAQWGDTILKFLNNANRFAQYVIDGRTIIFQSGGNSYSTDFILVSLVQLLIDDFYRTITGFCILIDKEWISYGYNFLENYTIFFHFINCVWEISQHNPTCLEFNDKFLIFLLDCLYDHRYSNFAFKTEKEYINHHQRNPPSPSLWDYILNPTNTSQFKNPFYNKGATSGYLKVTDVKYCSWTSLYFRWNWSAIEDTYPVTIQMDQYKKKEKRSDMDVNLQLEENFFLSTEIDEKMYFLTILTISKYPISHIPNEIAYLTRLSKLRLNHNSIVHISPLVSNLTTIVNLNLRDNVLDHIPFALFSLEHLVQLRLDSNKITCIPNQIAKWTALQGLSMVENELENLPTNFSCLVSLITLDLSKNKLRILPSYAIHNMTQLKSLCIAKNRLQSIPQNIGCLTNLTDLNLMYNNLKYLPPSLGNCKSLSNLFLHTNTLLECLPKSIQWYQLKKLDVHNTALIAIPDNIGKCSSLIQIWASECNIKNVPNSIRNCRKLEILNMDNNKITVVSAGIGYLTNLTRLSLNGNNIKTLPLTIAYLTKLETLSISNNPDIDPPQLQTMDTTEIMKYIQERIKKTEPQYRIRLMVFCVSKLKSQIISNITQNWIPLPSDNVNPTRHHQSSVPTASEFTATLTHKKSKYFLLTDSLLQSTTNDGESSEQNSTSDPLDLKKDEETEGLQISNYTIPFPEEKESDAASNSAKNKKIRGILSTKPVKTTKSSNKSKKMAHVSIWDFDANVSQTHQFFMSPLSLFLLVVSLDSVQDIELLDFWLQSIRARVSMAAVIVVAMHDNLAPEEVENRVERYHRRIRHIFSKSFKVLKILPLSLQSPTNLDKIRNIIQEEILNHKYLGRSYPNNYTLLEKLLIDIRASTIPIISKAQFTQLCQECGIPRDDSIKCAQALTEFGSIVYFDSDRDLSDMVILDPTWLVNAISTLFTWKNHGTLKDGILPHSMLQNIWFRFQRDIHVTLLHLLHKFEISYPLQENQKKTLLSLLLSVEDVSQFYQQNEIQTPSPPPEAPANTLFPSEPVSPHFQSSFSLIPSLFTQNPPPNLSTLWPPSPPSGVIHLERIYQFQFVPNLLISRLLLRLLSTSEPKALWVDGIIAVLKTSTVFLEHYSSTDLNGDEAEREDLCNFIAIRVRGGEIGVLNDVFRIVIDMLENLLRQWPNLVRTRYAISPVDPERKDKISIEKIEKEVLAGKRDIKVVPVNPNKPEYCVPITAVAPDIVMDWYKGIVIPVEEIEIEKRIGEGGFASVYKAKWNTEIALKQINMSSGVVSAVFQDFRDELFIHHQLKHPNIVNLLGISMKPFSFIMEYLSQGNLYDYLRDFTIQIDWESRIKIALGIASGISYIHERNIVHCDMKSPNILMGMSGNELTVKLADFGTARILNEKLTGRFVDNPVWLAPEILLQKPYNDKVDTYAFGVILWELLARSDFFGDSAFLCEIEQKITSGERPDIPEFSPLPYQELINNCWHQNPEKRPLWKSTIADLEGLQSMCVEFDKDFGVMEQEFIKKKKEDLKLEEQNKHIALENRIKAEADQARLLYNKDKKKRDWKKTSSPDTSSSKLFDLFSNYTLLKKFESSLMESSSIGLDIRFYLDAKRFQTWVHEEKKLRFIALVIASTYLGFSNINPQPSVVHADKEKIKKVTTAIIHNEITNILFVELADSLEVYLKKAYANYITQRRVNIKHEDTLSSIPTQNSTLFHSRAEVTVGEEIVNNSIIQQVLSDSILSEEFDQYLNYTSEIQHLFRYYKSFLQHLELSEKSSNPQLLSDFLAPYQPCFKILDTSKIRNAQETAKKGEFGFPLTALRGNMEDILEQKILEFFQKSQRKKKIRTRPFMQKIKM